MNKATLCFATQKLSRGKPAGTGKVVRVRVLRDFIP